MDTVPSGHEADVKAQDEALADAVIAMLRNRREALRNGRALPGATEIDGSDEEVA